MNDMVLMNKLLETASSLGWKMETYSPGPNESLTELFKPSPLGIAYTLYLKPQDMSTPESFLRFVRTQAFGFNLHAYMLELSTWTDFDENQTIGAHIDDCFAVQQSVSSLAQELQLVYDSYHSDPAPVPAITLTDVDGKQLQLCYDHEKGRTILTTLDPSGIVENCYGMEDSDFIRLLKLARCCTDLHACKQTS